MPNLNHYQALVRIDRTKEAVHEAIGNLNGYIKSLEPINSYTLLIDELYRVLKTLGDGDFTDAESDSIGDLLITVEEYIYLQEKAQRIAKNIVKRYGKLGILDDLMDGVKDDIAKDYILPEVLELLQAVREK